MKLRVDRNGPLQIASVDLDAIKTDIKWVEVNTKYFLVLKEESGVLVPAELWTKPKGLCVQVEFEAIYKSYALANYGIEMSFPGQSEVEVDTKDNKFVVVGK